MVSATVPSTGWQRVMAILATFAILIAMLWCAQRFFVILALAVLIGFILQPVVTGLQRLGLNRVIAFVCAVAAAFSLIGLLGWLVATQVSAMTASWAEYKGAIEKKINDVDPWRSEQFLLRKFYEAGQEIVTRIPTVIGPALESIVMVVFVVILIMFMLLRREDLRNRAIRLLGQERGTVLTTRALDEASQRISRFLLMQVTINAAFGLVLGVGLYFLGLPYAPLWGFIAALMRFVPYIGTWISMVLPIFFSLATSSSWIQPLGVLAIYLMLEIVTANVLEPLLFGMSAGISPVALLVAAIFWDWLWGPIGLILSTPLTVCLLVLGRYVPRLHFLEILLGEEPALPASTRYYQRLLARDQDEAAEMVEHELETKPPADVMDEIMVPALVLAKVDRERGQFSPEDEQFILRATRDIVAAMTDKPGSPEEAAAAKAAADCARVYIIGCPGSDEVDELALEMLQSTLGVAGDHLEIVSVRLLSSEVVAAIEKELPALVFVAALPPGGLAPTRYLCKKLRSRFPDLQILIGRWCLTEDQDLARKRLLASGASDVAFTLSASRAQVMPILQVAGHLAPPPKVSQAS